MMLKLKLLYFGHLMWRIDSLEKTLMLGGIGGRRRRGWQRMRWLDGITDLMDIEFEWTLGVGDGQGDLACCDSWGRKESDMNKRLNWTECHLGSPPFTVVQQFHMVSQWHQLIWLSTGQKKERMKEVGQKDRCLWYACLLSWLSFKLDQLFNLLIFTHVVSPNLHRVETRELLVFTFKPERKHTVGCSPRGIFTPSSWPLFSKLSSVPSWFL